MPELPPEAGIAFRTKLEMAAEAVAWAGAELPERPTPPWVVVDGGYAKREFLKPAMRAGFVVVARLRKDAALFDLPPVAQAGAEARPGPPADLRQGPAEPGQAGRPDVGDGRTSTVRTTAGQVGDQAVKTFLATWRPAGGVVRVVILKEDDGSWRAFLCTDAGAAVEAIVQAVLDRWAIEQNFHDLKEVERIEEVQLRRVWSNVGALNLSLWVHTLIEVWAWGRPAEDVERPE